ncbi:MAG: GGDEF domain-containing protein [Clostridiales bacterium]|nr:GGDEF domain-containing protein [Clostridiales bacterium]
MLWLLRSNAVLKNYRRTPFFIGVTLTVIIILAEAGTVFTDYRAVNILCNVIGFSLAPMIPLVIVLIFDNRLLGKRRLLLIPTLINIVAVVLSPLFGYIFHVDADNRYVRGDYFFIFIAVYIINFLILIICTLETGKRYNYPIRRKMIALSLFTIMGTSIQLVNPSIYSSWHCVTLSLLLYYFMMSDFHSSFDTLTGLYTRAAFNNAAKQISKAFSVIALDIDDFKSINDTYGHAYGDTVIRTIAEIVRKSFARHCTCYRFGGDEFMIISDETDEEKLEYRLSLMKNSLKKERERGNALPTVSYGYSIFRGGKKPDFNKILKEADARMYQFKKTSKPDASDEIFK